MGISLEQALKISVIVPVYNAEAYLSACVESLLAQSYKNIEIILIDDGSTDRSGMICDDYARRDSRVKVLHKANGGVSAARNDGLALASGSFIGFADSDDWAEAEMYETLLAPFIREPATQVSICGWYRHEDGKTITRGGGAQTESMDGRDAMRRAMRGNWFEGYLWNKLFRAELFKPAQNGDAAHKLREDIFICEDLLLCCQVFAKCGRVFYNPAPLYHYIVRPGSALRCWGAKRETEYIARQEIIRLTQADPELHGVAEFSYAQSLLKYAYDARKAGFSEQAGRMRKLAGKETRAALCCGSIGFKGRLKLLLMYIAPGFSLWLWQRLRESLHLQWTTPNDK